MSQESRPHRATDPIDSSTQPQSSVDVLQPFTHPIDVGDPGSIPGCGAMQTFLPAASFERSAQVLDYRRLGNQRLEAKQILQALLGQSAGWRNHPATKMWQGYEVALADYGMVICREWASRGYVDNLFDYFFEVKLSFLYPTINPPWIGWAEFHASHRSNLLRKDPEHYGQFGWTEPPDLPYIWP